MFLWLSLLRIFFASTGLKSLGSLSFMLRTYFLVDCIRFFWQSYFTLTKKTHFKFWCPISREPKNLGKPKKQQIQAKRCNFHVQPQEFTNAHFHMFFFFKFSISSEMRRNDVVSKGNVEHVKHVIRMAQFKISKSESYSSKPRWIFSISSIWRRDIALQSRDT